jgi:hypothetical protein
MVVTCVARCRNSRRTNRSVMSSKNGAISSCVDQMHRTSVASLLDISDRSKERSCDNKGASAGREAYNAAELCFLPFLFILMFLQNETSTKEAASYCRRDKETKYELHEYNQSKKKERFYAVRTTDPIHAPTQERLPH